MKREYSKPEVTLVQDGKLEGVFACWLGPQCPIHKPSHRPSHRPGCGGDRPSDDIITGDTSFDDNRGEFPLSGF